MRMLHNRALPGSDTSESSVFPANSRNHKPLTKYARGR